MTPDVLDQGLSIHLSEQLDIYPLTLKLLEKITKITSDTVASDYELFDTTLASGRSLLPVIT